jgi:hypothetical protein
MTNECLRGVLLLKCVEHIVAEREIFDIQAERSAFEIESLFFRQFLLRRESEMSWKQSLTADHIESAFRRVRQHVEFFGLAHVHGQIVDELFGVVDEGGNESLEDFQVE